MTISRTLLALAATAAFFSASSTTTAAPYLWAGGTNTCAAVNGAAYCWGANIEGQVGNGTFSMATTPSQVQGLTTGVQAIVTSGAHTCAIVNGGAYCWGNNAYGQLGNNGSATSPVPVAVSGLSSGVTAIAVGDLHSCAVHNGAAKCWGSGGYGQLGTGASIFSSAVPTAVAGLGTGVLDVNAGRHHTCALLSSGAARCWGRGDSGEMGDGTNTYINLGPVQVSGATSDVQLVSTGAFFNCGISNGAAYCWGYGGQGRLGNGSGSNINTPSPVTGMGSGVSWLSAGNGMHACGLGNAGPVCWGANNAGQLGNASVPGGTNVPVAVQGLPGGVEDIAAGGLHSCASTDTAIYCWGNNSDGQLGTGNQVSSGTPVLVMNVPAPPVNNARLVNLSTRGQVMTGNDVMIAGFIIGGPTAKTVAVTVAGPSLVAAGIPNALSNPTLTLIRSSDGAVMGASDNWGDAPNAAAIQAAGFAPAHPAEPAVMMTLAPGAYTAIVQASGGVGTGVGLVGVYEVDHPEVPLTNISTRGQVLTGNDVMIAGFIVQGTGTQTVVVTVAGPSLIPAGIPNALANPTLYIVRATDGAVIASNDNWQTQTNPADAAAIQAAGFAPAHVLEPAVKLTLPPGAYTAVVQGTGGTGVGLVGVYRVP
ncbi:RCC1 domain-containing protein [Usitatibacter palustris]|uniref:Alpha-tubulin suppressor n=1 Tax=Usitatibacter palustris TaxID=2732487 RepID=A0A6M4HDR5_9PROT|nr:hypothetical protein [Usitatibacter palustris]QJR16127.1 hypothetical protein DSM104440_02956 [Usitatibacter palustris]